ncbi:vitamin K epoxide reductase family protein [Nocardioides litoris]|uniref:vitamin K epoxide reductase family protein n=1 Tax=Nocardioides litoris TaxID=1926648 RepID=UPI0011239668|nr:vitamin K epoxide reductase family protein [Nocardioides litoris]
MTTTNPSHDDLGAVDRLDRRRGADRSGHRDGVAVAERDDLDHLSDDEVLALLARERRTPRPTRAWGVVLAVLGLLGLAAAFTLAVDKYKILEDPSYVPSCNLNPVLSCGSIMRTDQASVLGFPNPLMGIVGFSVVVTLGVLLASGVRLPRGVLAGLAAGGVVGAGFVHWLAYQSMFEIGALCPWCLVVWTVTLPVALWSVLVAAGSFAATRGAATAVWRARWVLLLVWYAAFVATALVQFWSYWRTLL